MLKYIKRKLRQREKIRIRELNYQKRCENARVGEQVSQNVQVPAYGGPKKLGELVRRYRFSSSLSLDNHRIPLIWWVYRDNFGDLLSPWLISRMTGHSAVYSEKKCPAYVAIGSIMKMVEEHSVVWGTGAFGTEPLSQITTGAKYCAVRGPLTRSKVLDAGGTCPRVYGDPALLVPLYFWPKVEKKYEYGVIVRWSEENWANLESSDAVNVINFGTSTIEQTLIDMLACKRIASSSLHGLILADAYQIPNAWIRAEKSEGGSRPKGGEFKFYDYFAAVEKIQTAQPLSVKNNAPQAQQLHYQAGKINFDPKTLLDSCPFLTAAPHKKSVD